VGGGFPIKNFRHDERGNKGANPSQPPKRLKTQKLLRGKASLSVGGNFQENYLSPFLPTK